MDRSAAVNSTGEIRGLNYLQNGVFEATSSTIPNFLFLSGMEGLIHRERLHQEYDRGTASSGGSGIWVLGGIIDSIGGKEGTRLSRWPDILVEIYDDYQRMRGRKCLENTV